MEGERVKITEGEWRRIYLIESALNMLPDPNDACWLADQWVVEGLISVDGFREIGRAIERLPAKRRAKIINFNHKRKGKTPCRST
jgi:hypothetical protein